MRAGKRGTQLNCPRQVQPPALHISRGVHGGGIAEGQAADRIRRAGHPISHPASELDPLHPVGCSGVGVGLCAIGVSPGDLLGLSAEGPHWPSSQPGLGALRLDGPTRTVGLWSRRIGDVSGLTSMADDLLRRSTPQLRANALNRFAIVAAVGSPLCTLTRKEIADSEAGFLS